MKQLTPDSKSVRFQFFKYILIGHFFHVLLTNKHSLHTSKMILETKINAFIKVLHFKVRQYIF